MLSRAKHLYSRCERSFAGAQDDNGEARDNNFDCLADCLEIVTFLLFFGLKMRLFCETGQVNYAWRNRGSAMWQIREGRKPMSTPNTDLDKDQEASRGAPGTMYTEDTIKLEKMSPVENVPQPPQPPSHNRRKVWFAIAAVVIVLALVFSVLAVFIAQPGKSPSTQVTPTTPQSVTQGPQNGPSSVNSPAYWDTILGTKGTNGKVESVSFANVMGNSTLQALVTVRHSDANSTLDVYVFDKITSQNPVQIFKLDGLIKGEAKISYYNSIMTAEVNTNSTINAGKSVSQMTTDLYREYAWVNGSMTQVAFPGIFPVMTRYQAEADQVRVNAGHDPWKNDAASVAKALEVQFLKWQRTVTTKVLSGGGPNDVDAIVRVQEAPIQNAQPTIVVTLSRLEGNTHNMWVAIGVTDSSTLTLKNITARQSISSPVTLAGTGAAFESQIGQAVVYDQASANIGQATVHANTDAGTGSYATKVSYTSSFHGVQEGIVAVYQDMGGLSAENETAVMVKVLVNPTTTTTSIQDPAYWTQFVSAPPAIRVADSVSFGHLLGNNSLQAVVVARDILGGGPVYRDVFVFDNINASHPQLLWHESRLLHGDAKISGYNTVMTSQVDANSSINKGKQEAGLTTDLFREFKWFSKSGSFEQVVFPGMFPDMTRWQAEESQNAVLAGQGAWRLDPVQTTQHWNLIAGTAKLVKGGWPSDLTAIVNVTYPDKGGPTTNIPITQVTLSRLEGNINGVWEITSVSSDWLSIYTPESDTTIRSPVPVTGFGPQFEAVIGAVYIRDHLYHEIQVGSNFAMAPDGSSAPSKFSLDVKYTSSSIGIAQEGIVELAHSSGASFARGEVMVKVLIRG
jgi:hypothetical protein